MTIRNIVYLPEPCLRQVCLPVGNIDAALLTLIDDMFETMYAAPGVGLAAPQIGISKRLSVIDVTQDKSEQFVLINPEILEARGEAKVQEGCLSLPGGIYEEVKRATWVKMRALNRAGEEYTITAEGLLAQCIQHEIDHLDGKLFIDHLSPLKRSLVRKKLARHKRILSRQKNG